MEPDAAQRELLLAQGWGRVDAQGYVRNPFTRVRCFWRDAVEAIGRTLDAIHPIPAPPDAYTKADGPLFGRTS